MSRWIYGLKQIQIPSIPRWNGWWWLVLPVGSRLEGILSSAAFEFISPAWSGLEGIFNSAAFEFISPAWIRVGRNLVFSCFRIHLSGMNQGRKESCLQQLSKSSLRHDQGWKESSFSDWLKLHIWHAEFYNSFLILFFYKNSFIFIFVYSI